MADVGGLVVKDVVHLDTVAVKVKLVVRLYRSSKV